LRVAAAGTDAYLAIAAAAALWRLERWPDALARLTAHADGPAANAALREIGELGPAAAPAVPYLATFLDAPDPHWWRPALAALAIWRATGSPDAVRPVLETAWAANEHIRFDIATTASGPLAVALEPLLRAELGALRRSGLGENVWSSDQIRADERLRTACRAALDGLDQGSNR
jgi:hypothetical protein